ncbi:MAG TPA: LysR family transcriptional regulator [Mycobacteriales bacterium]|nr:LysR family transcriptional regulator [Mycobacteriales bacterium]
MTAIELRQLRYFVALAEELHFGRAAEREHIVQSGLSQHIKRLERELEVKLLERSTHHVQLTRAGVAFLAEARLLLAQADRAVAAARRAGSPAAALWVGTVDASYDSMPQVLREVRQQYPSLAVHQVEAGVPEQLKLLTEGRLDVGFGRASLAPAEIASELVRLDPMGVLVAAGHRFATRSTVPVTDLVEEPVLLGEDERAPEFNQFVVELCRSVGFTPNVARGTVQSMQAAADLVVQGWCVASTPASCTRAFPGVVWRPLVDPVAHYPWSLLWRAGDQSEYVQAVRVRTRGLARSLRWLEPAGNHGSR